MKRIVLLVLLLLPLCTFAFDVTTNGTGDEVLESPSGAVVLADTPLGYFWRGFGIAVMFYGFGWCYRITKRIGGGGHMGGTYE